MKQRAIVLSALLVVSMLGAVAAPAASHQEGDAYAGTHVEFESDANSVSNYAVNDAVVVESATMQSSSEARSQAGLDVGADIRTMGNIDGAAISGWTEARASVSVKFANGGGMESHDNQRGVVQFVAENGDQIVQVNVSEDAETSSESDSRLIVESGDGTQGAFIVVGEGQVTTNDEGQVNAEIEDGSQLVYRQYDEERSEDDAAAERMIEEGTATAEVYVQQSSEDGQETAANAIEYGQDTTVEVVSESRNTVELTVERSEEEGKVLLTSIQNEAFENAEDVEVRIDGNVAAQADSYGEVESAASEGEEASYYVAQSSSTEATTDVAIGIDHFSERDVEMSSGEGGSDGDGAGVGALGALLVVVASLMAVRYRS